MHAMKNVCNPAINPLAVVVCAGLLLPFRATATDNTVYVGVGGVGRVTVDRNVSDFDDGSVISGRVDDKDSGWKLFAGYRFNKRVAVEVGYTDLNNDTDHETTFVGQSNGLGDKYAAGKVSVDIDEPVALYVAAVGRLPMPLGPAPYDERLAILTKAGIAAWEATQTTIDATSKVDKDDDGVDFMIGLGLEYRWPNGFGVRGEWEFYRDIVDEDYELNTLGLTYDF